MGTQNRRFRIPGDIVDRERTREKLQKQIDETKTIDSRRALGQFSTPYDLACEIVDYGLQLHSESEVSFLEPAIGTGAFYSALLSEIVNTKKSIDDACGIEVDKDFFDLATSIWSEEGIDIINSDFTKTFNESKKYNFLICNPPYVRHHYIDQMEKIRLSQQVNLETNIEISGLSGLYCYFLLLAHKWLAPNAVCGWLLPSEFMDVNYGKAVKEYLLDKVHLLRIHRYDPHDCKFDDALVSSCVVWFKNEKTEHDYEIEFSYGGIHNKPSITKIINKSVLHNERKWTRFPEKNIRKNKNFTIGDYFDVKRGLATGDNDFFILTKEQIEELGIDMMFFKPILPSPRYLKTDEVMTDSSGFPKLEKQMFLLDCIMPEEEIEVKYHELWNYLQSGLNTTAKNYLCKNRKRWYSQEKRLPTPFLCSYMGRSSERNTLPFRFILNHSDAIASNSYLMLYPKCELKNKLKASPELVYKIWNALKEITALDMENEGRIYGGGLKKIEPKELAQVECNSFTEIFTN